MTERSQSASAAPARDPIAFLFLGVLGMAWGLSFSLSKIAAVGGIHPIAYTWMQATGASVFLTVVCWRAGIRFRLSRRFIVFYIAAGLTGLALPNMNIVMVAVHLPAGIISVLVTIVPMLSYVFAVALRLERARIDRAAGILLGFSGVAFLVIPKASLPSPEMVPWVLVGLLTPLLYATNNMVSVKMRPEGTHSLLAAWGMVTTASIVTLPVMLATDTFHPWFVDPSPADWAMLGQTGVSCLAYVLFFEIVRRAGPVFASTIAYVVMLTGLAWGWLIFGEQHSAWVWAAVALVFAGLALLNLRRG